MLLLGILAVLAWGAAGLGGGTPAPAGGGVTLVDNFNRADNADISVGAPFSWTEIEPTGLCAIRIVTNALTMESNSSTDCDNDTFQIRADSDLDTVDQWVLFKRKSHAAIWAGGPGAILRTQSGADLGQHYEARCNSDTCGSIRIERINGVNFQEGITLDSSCDSGDGWTTIGDGDYVGVSVSGTGASTVFKMWDHGATDPGDDPGTWGTATCTPALIGATTKVDTGNRIGLRAFASGASATGEFQFEEMSGGDL